APKVDEAALAAGLEASKVWIREAVELQIELRDAVGTKPTIEYKPQVDYTDEIFAAVEAAGADRITATQKIADKTERQTAENALRDELVAELLPRFVGEGDDGLSEADATKQLKAAIRSLTKKIVRKRIVEE